jgi:hypothetical protein
MASTDPTNVGPSLNFINATPEDFTQTQQSGSNRRDEDEDMKSTSSKSDELEYGTPIQNDNNPGEGFHSQNAGVPNNERHDEFQDGGVPGQGWDGTGFDVAPEIQAQELLNHMREVSQWSDTFAFMYPRQVDRFLQPVFALCRDVLRLQTCSLSNPDAESTNSNTNITGILKSLSRELNEVKNEIARINKTATKGNCTTGLDQVETDH